ncbi:MAG TPA: hypothetical protein PKX94_08560, partial [Opitutales bacterium]|nr:hypothetical protein [Opitutales bacterium]
KKATAEAVASGVPLEREGDSKRDLVKSGVFRSGRLLLFGRLMIKTVLFIIVPEPRSFARAYQTHNKPILLIIKKHLHVLENIARNPRVN